MGSNLIQVMTYGRGTGGTRDVDVENLYELVDKYPQYLTGVTPYVSASAKVRYQTDDYDRTSVYGVSEAFFEEDTKGTMQGETLAEGRFSATSTWIGIRMSASSAIIWRRPPSGRRTG